MEFIYNYNALPFYTEEDLIQRQRFTHAIANCVKKLLLQTNKSWTFYQIEAPTLIPRELISENYTSDDIWEQKQHNNSAKLVLKPETTPSTYAWMYHKMDQQEITPPVCVWQLSKSYRREQDQPTKHCRFKEFYQQEFQCVYTVDTKNDYFEQIIKDLAQAFALEVCCPTRLVVSDRLPSYSEKTWDIEVFNSEKWMEVASISVRNDFKKMAKFKNKEVACKVLEIATSPDRLTYCWNKRLEANKQFILDSSEIEKL